MIYIILIIAAVILLFSLFKTLLYNIFTLSFLPAGLGMFDGNVASYTIPIIGPTIGIIINYLVACVINLVDFFVLFIVWIPGLGEFVDFIYRSPDMVERWLDFIFGGIAGHRNFITHSMFNPVFLVFLIIVYIITAVLPKNEFGTVVDGILFLIGMTFVCHLLADTMPQAWQGTANIKVYLFTYIFTMPSWMSKGWLYINAGLSFKGLCKACRISDE